MTETRPINRRSAMFRFAAAAACIAAPARSVAGAESSKPSTGLGLVVYDCNIRRKWMRERNPGHDLFEPLTFLRYCQSLGAGGMQASLGVMDARQIGRLREFADQHALFIDAIVRPPNDHADLERFEAEITTARDVGVQAARTTIIPGRRYERFKTLAEFREYERRGQAMLERAAPIVEKHRVPLAVENHKDQRIDEQIALYQHLSSEFIGACVDTGNSFALLDGAYEPIEALAPYAFTVHLKDQALREYQDGFLLGDIPLGQGSFDLQRMVKTLKSRKPEIRFALELITRDALKVPCLTDAFWAPMPTIPGRDLARTLSFVRQHPAKHVQRVSTLTAAKQVDLEDANVSASLEFAGRHLDL